MLDNVQLSTSRAASYTPSTWSVQGRIQGIEVICELNLVIVMEGRLREARITSISRGDLSDTFISGPLEFWGAIPNTNVFKVGLILVEGDVDLGFFCSNAPC